MSPPRILIYRCGAIGDTIVAIPAIRAVRNHFPDSSYSLMTAGGGEGIVWTDAVLREFGWFDHVITYEASELRSPMSLWSIVKRVRAVAPDIVIYLGSDKNSALKVWRDHLFFRVAGVKRFFGTKSRKVTPWGYLRRSPATYPSEVDRLLREMDRFGMDASSCAFDLPIRHEHVFAVEAHLKDSGLDLSRPLVAMCPGSKQKIKVWPEERFAEIGRRLTEQAGVNIAIVGGGDEAAVGERLARSWPPGRTINLAQRLSILESAALLQRCALYVGNDTGAMHLAAAVGTRCVAIFSAREPARSWHPYGQNHVILRKSVTCQNCYLSECTREDLRCLRKISVDEVWAACRRALIYQ